MNTVLHMRAVHAERGKQQVLSGMDLDVQAGEVCALMGVSGAGKSTALRAIAALQPFSRGSITVGACALRPGPVPAESRLRALRSQVGMVFQAHALFEHLTALENVMLSPVHVLGWPRARAESVARELLDSLGVASRADALPRQLSGGEAQRVAIARALALDPPLLLLDEPTSALDPARRSALGDTVRSLARSGRALLLATHDVEFAEAHVDRVAVLSRGMVVEQGPATDVLRSPRHAATRALLTAPVSE
ncbi:MAG: ATP-binding cassette domain-containing protein [Gemmatimonadaceae bacterium]